MNEPEIRDCGCGKDHETMPIDFDPDLGYYELVCKRHKRHEPCRSCLAEDGFYDKT